MHWLNINLTNLRSPAYLGSTPVERATWLQLLAYCVDQENGGIIAGAASWKDRQWQQTCGVTAREVRGAARLVAIEGGDVRVAFYPLEKQCEVQAKREAARLGGLNSGKSRARRSAGDEAVLEANGEAAPERKEKGKEGNENGMYATPPVEVVRVPSASAPVSGASAPVPVPVCSSREAVEHGARLVPPCPEQWCLKWWEDCERRGWVDRDNIPVRRWQPALSSYWRGVQEMERRMSANGASPSGNDASGNGSASGVNGHAPPRKISGERPMSAYDVKTRLVAIDDELARIRLRAKDGRSEDGLRTIKLYTPGEEARRGQLQNAKEILKRKLTEV